MSNYLNESVDPAFLKNHSHSAWDLALTSNEYFSIKQKVLDNSKTQQQKASSSLQLKKVPLTNLASRLINVRKDKEELEKRASKIF